MNVQFNSDDCMREIVQDLGKLPELPQKVEKKVYTNIKNVILKHLKRFIPRDFDDVGSRKNYDGSTPYIEMADDIKASVKTKEGQVSLIIKGGKKTGYKWHMLDDGTRFPDGRAHTKATHFTSNTMKAAEPEIESIIDSVIREALGND